MGDADSLPPLPRESPAWLTVLTSPKRPMYLGRTLASLDMAGAFGLRCSGELQTLICVDADPIPKEFRSAFPTSFGWTLVSVGAGGGTRRAMRNIIRLAAAAAAPALLYCEDDIQPCDLAVTGAMSIEVPAECGFLSLCDVRTLAGPELEPPRIVTWAADDPRIKPGFWGSMALLIPGPSLGYLATREIRANDWPYASDVWIGEQLASKTAPWQRFGVVAPSLFQHVGERSAVNPAWTLESHRVASTWRSYTNGVSIARALRRRDPF